MAVVTDALVSLLRKQVDSHQTVIWFDPEKVYLGLAESLTAEALAGAAFFRYEPERGFVWLRHQLESLWSGDDQPRLVLYVPLAQVATHHALIEFEVSGAVMQPGQQPPERNTALAVVARLALEPILPPARLDHLLSEVTAGKWSLAELNHEAEQGKETQTGVLKVVFGTGNAGEIALRFVTDPDVDARIAAKDAVGSLASLLMNTLGSQFPTGAGLAGVRSLLARQIIVTDFCEALGDKLPESLRTMPLASSAAARQAAAKLGQEWRNRRDLSESYVRWAKQVQAEIGAASLNLNLDALARSETFLAIEMRLQTLVETALAAKVSAQLVEQADRRHDGFWSAQKPEVKTRWEVIADAGRVLMEANRVERELKGKAWSAATLVRSYAGADHPWCELDSAQRRMERDFRRFDLVHEQHGSLLQLVTKARQRYTSVADSLAQSFTEAYAHDHFEVAGVLAQSDVYKAAVAPVTASGRAAFLLVDALRFEMARDLLSAMDDKWTSELVPALAAPPTVTEIGMAALLPGAESGMAVVSVEGNKLAVVMGGKTLKSRDDRLAYFKNVVKDMTTCRLEELAPLTDAHLRQRLQDARLIVATETDEIDTLCETNPALARRMLDDVFSQIRRGVKTLFNLGVQTVVISADHGYLFGESLTAGEGIDAPGGKTAMLKRRAWVGQGGSTSDALLRRPLSAFGIGGELEIATPWNLSCLKSPGGGTEYYHGGLSLQELVIPVLTIRQKGGQPAGLSGQIHWQLTCGSAKITTRFVSVTVAGQSGELLPLKPPTVRVEVRSGDKPISVPVSASYGFQEATRDVALQTDPDNSQSISKNTVTLMISETPQVNEVTVHLLDSATGITLAKTAPIVFAITL